MNWKQTLDARADDIADDFTLPIEIRTEASELTPSPSRQIIVDFYESIYVHLSESYAGMAEALNEEAGLRSGKEADLGNVKADYRRLKGYHEQAQRRINGLLASIEENDAEPLPYY